MPTSRVEAFSDGVLAIIITIMVLELKVPGGDDAGALWHTTGSSLLTYLLSFVYVGIYWNNHHHMFQLVGQIHGGVLWANLALLFCLSLFPFTTAWVDETKFQPTPVVVYGINLLAAGRRLLRAADADHPAAGTGVAVAAGHRPRPQGQGSPVLYLAGILCALLIDRTGRFGAAIGEGFFVAVAIMWVVPDPRIERAIREHDLPG